jgi:hypothetical protein
MKKLLKKLKKINKRIKDLLIELENARTLPYYRIFGSEGEKRIDIQKKILEIKNLEKVKLQFLFDLKTCIDFEIEKIKV